MSVSTHTIAEGKSCICVDPQVDRLRELVAAGWAQVEASRVLWGDPVFSDLSQEARLEVVGADARRAVREGLQAAFPWLHVTKGAEAP